MQSEYIEKMVDNLPILRAAASFSQAELAEHVGVSRQTIIAVERKSRPLAWTLCLAMAFVFSKNKKSRDLMDKLSIFIDFQ